MPAFVLVNFDVLDPARFEPYRTASLRTIADHGGILRIRTTGQPLHGALPHGIVALIEFKNAASAAGWYHSAEYQSLIQVRDSAANMTFTLFEGMP